MNTCSSGSSWSSSSMGSPSGGQFSLSGSLLVSDRIQYSVESHYDLVVLVCKGRWHQLSMAVGFVNSWASQRRESIFKSMIFKHMIWNSDLGTHCEIALRWMPQNLTNKKSTLVEVMAWCHRHQAITWANADRDICQHMASLSLICPWNIQLKS